LEHPNAQAALEWLKAKRNRNGRWRGASPYRRRTWEALGSIEDTSRWATLQAEMILQEAAR
jgi:hypothetical protein